MGSRAITDPESLARQQRLLTAFETLADYWLATAEQRERAGEIDGARAALNAARDATVAGLRVQNRLAVLTPGRRFWPGGRAPR